MSIDTYLFDQYVQVIRYNGLLAETRSLKMPIDTPIVDRNRIRKVPIDTYRGQQ